jgi:hypothetical protein
MLLVVVVEGMEMEGRLARFRRFLDLLDARDLGRELAPRGRARDLQVADLLRRLA